MTLQTYIILAYFAVPLFISAFEFLLFNQEERNEASQLWSEIVAIGQDSMSVSVRSFIVVFSLATLYIFWPVTVLSHLLPKRVE